MKRVRDKYMKTKKMKCKRRNWQGFSRFVTNFLSVQST
jgi:hypothetical protein